MNTNFNNVTGANTGNENALPLHLTWYSFYDSFFPVIHKENIAFNKH